MDDSFGFLHPNRVFAESQNWRDARASFLLPAIANDDGTTTASTIKRLSANPTLDADLHLNPPGGMLSGTNRATAYGGWVYFRDLFVRTRGAGYKLNFEAYLTDLLDVDDLIASSASSSGTAFTTTSSDYDLAVKERGLALKSSTLFEASHSGIQFSLRAGSRCINTLPSSTIHNKCDSEDDSPHGRLVFG